MSAVPYIALVRSKETMQGDWDDAITLDASEDDIRAVLDRWQPTADAPRFAELANGFGARAIRPVAQGLYDQLGDAVIALDSGSFAQVHRIAGLAGTLGFRKVSKTWASIDAGHPTTVATARREARLAMAALARWLLPRPASPAAPGPA